MASTATRIGAGLILLAGAALAATPACSSDTTNPGTGGSAADGTTTTTATTATGTGGSMPAMPSCSDYCTTIMANCTGDLTQYTSMDICMNACADFPEGTTADTTGDTVGCRDYHSHAAAADPTTHCPHAGPSGGDGVCGTFCQSFCSLAVAACPMEYPTSSGCATACAQFDMAAGQTFSINDTTGDNVLCRIYHATAAASDPTTHCMHITAASTPDTCGMPATP